MIQLEKKDLSPKEDRELRAWLHSPSAILFIDILKSEAANENVQLTQILEQQAIDLSCGGALPSAALPKIRSGATIHALISLLQKKIQQKDPFYRAIITIP